MLFCLQAVIIIQFFAKFSIFLTACYSYNNAFLSFRCIL
ncbi:hypothetical protein X781_12080 [Mannheimia sp. USDA-ARS-USMARC-1261]|nr:hypothetical protein X781_12080 [Mannheimia sp. USDA-ARS-USMARC-1261]